MKEIVIKLTDNCYKRVVGYKENLPVQILEAIRHGVVLPKGHGRIADVDKMLDEMRATRTYDILFALERVKPIIEADKTNKKDKN